MGCSARCWTQTLPVPQVAGSVVAVPAAPHCLPDFAGLVARCFLPVQIGFVSPAPIDSPGYRLPAARLPRARRVTRSERRADERPRQLLSQGRGREGHGAHAARHPVRWDAWLRLVRARRHAACRHAHRRQHER